MIKVIGINFLDANRIYYFSPNNIKLTGFWLRVQEPNSQSIDLYLTNINKDDIVYAYE